MSVAAADKTRSVNEITYTDLYKRWEQSNWSAYDLDFTQDRVGWNGLSDIQRASAMWIYSMFFYGEDAVTDGLSPYIEAAPTEEQKYFLATQQVDEARHAVFFGRFFKEVIGAGDTFAEGLAFTEPQLNWGYRGAFARLEKMFDELHADRSLPKFAQAITLYHMIIEASMAQPTQHYIEDFFAKAETMPGFSEGMENVSRDEQRHIGFGVKVLSELVAGPQGEECKAAITEIMREVMPYVVSVLTPPNWDREYTRAYGFELEDIFAFGMKAVEAKWRMIGFPLHEMPGVYPFDPEMPHRERAERQIAMLQAGFLGDPQQMVDATPEVQGYFFDVVAKSADPSVLKKPMTIQWKFSDAENFHVHLDNGSTRAVQGDAEKADVTFRTTLNEWVNVSTRGGNARRAMLSGKVRATGAPWKLMRLQKVFPQRPPALDRKLQGAGNSNGAGANGSVPG
jgi:ribonucleotide reductase beta subunit family protein with ferritin-like domain/putative sterol carrier protein